MEPSIEITKFKSALDMLSVESTTMLAMAGKGATNAKWVPVNQIALRSRLEASIVVEIAQDMAKSGDVEVDFKDFHIHGDELNGEVEQVMCVRKMALSS